MNQQPPSCLHPKIARKKKTKKARKRIDYLPLQIGESESKMMLTPSPKRPKANLLTSNSSQIRSLSKALITTIIPLWTKRAPSQLLAHQRRNKVCKRKEESSKFRRNKKSRRSKKSRKSRKSKKIKRSKRSSSKV